MSNLLVNLSALIARPTGISTYAINLLPHLQPLFPHVLSSRTIKGFQCHLIPQHMGADAGMWGHGKRLLWLQTQLPRWYRQLGSQLLFSPLPEAPLFRSCSTVVTVHDLIPLRFPTLRRSPIGIYYRYYVPAVLRQSRHIL
ncbi:MAG: glycosyltransferase family 1 protein, partial [Cyanobacteria bacterium REEB444]|nr:glycosyltransferase family 1 protein [Cyanobacteria bacterium REEB444]